jgi:TldD protein
VAHSVDVDFLAMPREALADAGLARARELGVSHADVRVERIQHQAISIHDRSVEDVESSDETGVCVRVVHDGAWGFAAATTLTADTVRALVDEAVALAKVSKPLAVERVELADEPVHADQTWVSDYEIDPFSVATDQKVALLHSRAEALMDAGATHANVGLYQVKEQTYYADLAGTSTVQQRVRLRPDIHIYGSHADTGLVDAMSTIAPPVGRGWEYVLGDGWDWDGEIAQLPEMLQEKLRAPSIDAGRYTVVIHPSNLWLTIHESIGHATELDRALGYEASYAGTSFATPDKLGTLRYGSELMHIVGDRTRQHGLASVGFDHEGVQAQAWDLVKDGTLVGYQLDRVTAARTGAARSNGCAFADSPGHMPIQRMANVSLLPRDDGPDLDGLIGGVEDGIFIVGDRSWSIDMQRYNFQFTGQRFFRIQNGALTHQVRDVAYQATTTDFWGSMAAVGGPSTFVLGGAFNCGKAQPGQVAPVSHGAPAAVFENVNILNTRGEGSHR